MGPAVSLVWPLVPSPVLQLLLLVSAHFKQHAVAAATTAWRNLQCPSSFCPGSHCSGSSGHCAALLRAQLLCRQLWLKQIGKCAKQCNVIDVSRRSVPLRQQWAARQLLRAQHSRRTLLRPAQTA